MSSLSSTASMSREQPMMLNDQSPPSDVITKTTTEGVKKSFTLIPGSKRLVSRACYTTPPRSPGKYINERIARVDDSNVPPFPSLRTSPRIPSNGNRKHFNSLEETTHGNGTASVVSAEGSAIRGGKLFKSVFSRSSNDVNGRNDRGHRSHKSMDALDIPMRNGVEKTNSTSGPPGPIDTRFKTDPIRPASALVDQLNFTNAPSTPLNETGSKEPDNGSLDDLLASAASTPSSHHLMMPPSGVTRAYSAGMVHPMWMEESTLPPSMLSTPALNRLHRGQTYGEGSHQQKFHYNIQQQHNYENYYPNLQMPQVPPQFPQQSSVGPHRAASSSDHSQNVGLTLDDSENSHSESQNNIFDQETNTIK